MAAAGSEAVAAPALVPTSRRPEIHHVFRAPDRRTPAIISVFFSALQVQPSGCCCSPVHNPPFPPGNNDLLHVQPV